MSEGVNVAVKLDFKCSCEKAYIRLWPVLCSLCVGNGEGVDSSNRVDIKQRG